MVRDIQKVKKLLILGIDPGTTTAYAVLDIDGNLVEVKSKKDYSFSSLILDVIKHGKILLIGTDVKEIPYFIKKVSRKVGSKIISPYYNIKVEEKKELTKEYKTSNDHERDALASAIIAFKRKRSLFSKIENYLAKNNKLELKYDVIELAILTSMTIKEIVDSLEKHEEKIEKKRKRQRTKINIESKKDEVMLLKQQNTRLSNELNELKWKLDKKEINIDKKITESLRFKDKRISELNSEMNNNLFEIGKLKNKINILNSYLKLMDKYILVSKIDNLSRDIKEYSNETIFVFDPNVFSEKLFDKIKNNINVIIYKTEPNKLIMDKINKIFIDVKKLDVKEEDNFILISKESLKNEMEKINILNNVIKNYKKERAKTLYSQA
ncbi:DUF460 domain-containing protein [Candidatus Woesearchaeota archaeon]|nr:DUF460 domain-containing protein [Candidatus Woesearchaeota archaeon]